MHVVYSQGSRFDKKILAIFAKLQEPSIIFPISLETCSSAVQISTRLCVVPRIIDRLYCLVVMKWLCRATYLTSTPLFRGCYVWSARSRNPAVHQSLILSDYSKRLSKAPFSLRRRRCRAVTLLVCEVDECIDCMGCLRLEKMVMPRFF